MVCLTMCYEDHTQAKACATQAKACATPRFGGCGMCGAASCQSNLRDVPSQGSAIAAKDRHGNRSPTASRSGDAERACHFDLCKQWLQVCHRTKKWREHLH